MRSVHIRMWLFIKNMIQLILSPQRGWEDISESAVAPEVLCRRGFYPWLAVVGLSEFLRLFYDFSLSVLTLAEHAVAMAGALFASLYLGRLFLEAIFPRYISDKANPIKIYIFTIYLTGLIGLYHIISCAMPARLTLLHFLPLLSLLVIFRSARYMDVPEGNTVTFLCLSAVAVIVVPVGMCALLTFII